MRQGFSKSAALVFCLLLSGQAASSENQYGKAEVKKEARHDVSPPLRNIHPAPLESGPPHEHKPLHPMTRKAPRVLQKDPVVQTSVGASAATTNGLNLMGVGVGFVGPVGSSGDIPPLRRYLEGLLDGTATAVDGWDFREGHERNVEALRS